MSTRIALPYGTAVKPGRYYRTRVGDILGPTSLDKPSGLFQVPGKVLLWSSDGTTADTLFDFVAELAVKEVQPEGVIKLSVDDVGTKVTTRGGATGTVIQWDPTPKVPPLFDEPAPDPFPLLVEFDGTHHIPAGRLWYNTAGFPKHGLPEAQLVRKGEQYAEGDYVIAGPLRLVCRIESGRAVRVRGDGTSFDLSEVSQLASDAAVRGALRSALACHLRQTVAAFRDAHPKHIHGAKDIEVRGAQSLANSVVQANP